MLQTDKEKAAILAQEGETYYKATMCYPFPEARMNAKVNRDTAISLRTDNGMPEYFFGKDLANDTTRAFFTAPLLTISVDKYVLEVKQLAYEELVLKAKRIEFC